MLVFMQFRLTLSFGVLLLTILNFDFIFLDEALK